MSRLNISRIQNENEDGSAAVSGISTFSSTAFLQAPRGSTAQRPTNPQPGAIRFNTDSGHLEYFTGEFWDEVLVQETASISARGLYAGGSVPSPAPATGVNTIDYITISTLGDATKFGELTQARGNGFGGCGSSTRSVFGGGGTGTPGTATFYSNIDYVTTASLGNAISFGSLTSSRQETDACSDSTRGIWAGGESATNRIDYVTIASTGNAATFGDLFSGRYGTNALAGKTRGIIYGGSGSNRIEYVTIQSLGNAVYFGDMTVARRSGGGGVSSSIRGILVGGYNTSAMDYITISTTGNASTFGNLSSSTYGIRAMSSSTRGVFAGLGISPAIQYITISTLGNPVSFGNLTQARYYAAATSNGHGGL